MNEYEKPQEGQTYMDVRLFWDGDDLGPMWMNLDNLKLMLFGKDWSTQAHLLAVHELHHSEREYNVPDCVMPERGEIVIHCDPEAMHRRITPNGPTTEMGEAVLDNRRVAIQKAAAMFGMSEEAVEAAAKSAAQPRPDYEEAMRAAAKIGMVSVEELLGRGGFYPVSMSTSLDEDGVETEHVTLVGNDRYWPEGPPPTFLSETGMAELRDASVALILKTYSKTIRQRISDFLDLLFDKMGSV